MDEEPHHGHKWMPVIHAHFYGILSAIAQEHGYALALHGTMSRDLDLVAVAWVENPKPHLEMLAAFRRALGTQRIDGLPYDSFEQKPHGRLGYTIQGGGGSYLDISIIAPNEALSQ
jgi:hypothetical protein